MRHLLLFRDLDIEGDENPRVIFLGGWSSANPDPDPMDQPECFCVMDAEQLCAAANAQGLSAAFQKDPNAVASDGFPAYMLPCALTISWPDASG